MKRTVAGGVSSIPAAGAGLIPLVQQLIEKRDRMIGTMMRGDRIGELPRSPIDASIIERFGDSRV
ncbi:MAG: hypothetical protein WAL68_18560 [Candidatus Binatus sp.]|jgi:hypothetical protein|uniref:hypothetical protein n=1 Tax=Candidatus Binatus sp. TaxID=2811406 RepID=UPI003BE29C3E